MMAGKSVISLSSICDFIVEKKLIRKGENSVNSGFVKKIMHDDRLNTIRAEVQASMKQKLYKVEIVLHEGEIQKASCDCPKGLDICHHMAAACIFAHKNLSVTDKACEWIKPKSQSDQVPLTAEECFRTSRGTFNVLVNEIDETSIQQFKEDLQLCGPTGLGWLLSPEPDVENTTNIVHIEDILFSEEYMNAENQTRYLLDKLILSDERILQLERLSVGQSANSLWHIIRKNRITASNFGKIIKATLRARYPPSLFQVLKSNQTLDGIKQIQWGRNNECNAIKLFEEKNKVEVRKTGIWLHPCGFLGATPDGLVGDDTIIEVKCPYKFKDNNLTDALANVRDYILHTENGNFIVNKTHDYYHQIQACNCNQDGSLFSTCDVKTGQCRCKPHYTGLTCSKCEAGYYVNSKKDCARCKCHPDGAINNNCDQLSGYCTCKQGAGGKSCDSCLEGYYGNVQIGCKKCDSCNKKGHMCDPNNGKCVCPPLSTGVECEKCDATAWGYEPQIGCKSCGCSKNGSQKLQCDLITGRCTCKIGYEGEKCDRCTGGYYDYPSCRKCNCDIAGTGDGECSKELCNCKTDGSCHCKENVQGKHCNSCKPNMFGLTASNPRGCTECFCFGRSKHCKESNLMWDKIRTGKFIKSNECISAQPCWKLSDKFMGDLTTSYGGYLTIDSSSTASFNVFVTGNDVTIESLRPHQEIQLVEILSNKADGWRIIADPKNNLPKCRQRLTKDCLMVILQSITDISIEPRAPRSQLNLKEVLLDTAKSNISGNPTHYVEQCECPKEYSSLSCQDPNKGYYRYYPRNDPSISWIDSVIGISQPCDCNGHSNDCDPVSGNCKNCRDNTAGDHCEDCSMGYYRDSSGRCSPCLCPSTTQNNALSCSPTYDGFVCNCKTGYSGSKCTECSDGFFRNGSACTECQCNPYGSTSRSCNSNGQCRCRPGFTGLKCSECLNDREFIENGRCVPCDECTQLLFNEIDKLNNAVDETLDLFKNGLSPPWKTLTDMLRKHKFLSKKYESVCKQADSLINKAKIKESERKIMELESKIKIQNDVLDKSTDTIENLDDRSIILEEELHDLKERYEKLINNLNSFGKSHVNVREALDKAEGILTKINEILGKFEEYNYEPVFRKCSKIYEQVEDIFQDPSINPEVLRDRILDLNGRISSMDYLLALVEAQAEKARLKNKQNTERIQKLKRDVKFIEDKDKMIKNSLIEVLEKIEAAEDMLEDVEEIQEGLVNLNLDELLTKLNHTDDDKRILEEALENVTKHVQMLEEKLIIYEKMFNFSKDEWKKINASAAYESIMRGIEEARDNANVAKDTLEKVLKTVFPDFKDPLFDEANLSLGLSDRLMNRISILRNKTTSLRHIKQQLDNLKYNVIANGKQNNNLTHIIHNMENDINEYTRHVSQLEDVIKNSSIISDEMNRIASDTAMNLTLQYDLIKKYQQYKDLASKEELDNLLNKVKKTREKLKELNTKTKFDQLTNTNEIFYNNRTNLSIVGDKMESLKNKIEFAKQTVNSLDLAFTIGNCTRKYNFMQPIDLKSFRVTFVCNIESGECTLFHWTDGNRYVKLTAKNDEVTLSIKTQNEAANLTLSKGEVKTTVDVQRFGESIQLRIGDEIKDGKIGGDIIEVGDVAIGSLTGTDWNCNDTELLEKSLVYNIWVNQQNIPVWNFGEFSGCCKAYKSENDSKTSWDWQSFNGNGYLTFNNAALRPNTFNLRFNFRTFDTDSLIYLAQENENPNAYISLSMQNSTLLFDMRHNDGTTKRIMLDKLYNDGSLITADITMTYQGQDTQLYILKANGETKESMNKVDKKNVFRIKKSMHYVGGIPPTFEKDDIPKEIIEKPKFVGVLKVDPVLDTNKMMNYGTSKSDGQLNLKKAWFPKNNGYLKLSSSIKPGKIFNITLVVRPLRNNSFIMVISKFVAINIKDGKLQVTLTNNKTLASKNLNLEVGDMNRILISWKGQNKLSVTVNENTEEFRASGLNELANVNTTDIVFGQDFIGGIMEIFVNNRPLYLNHENVKEFSNVNIGRDEFVEKPRTITMKMLHTPHEINRMQNTERCSSESNYATDQGAIKFGDKPQSYIYMHNTLWKKDYVLEFEFRTFYPNGLLYIATGSQLNQHYTLLELREGRVQLHIKGKKSKKFPFLSEKVSDGEWHKIRVSHQGVKKKRKLTLEVDGRRNRPLKVPKNSLRSELYLGGVADNVVVANELINNLHPFRGCIRYLKINDVQQILVKNSKNIAYNNIGQCFLHTEKGAYFGGDAYAVYQKSFQVSRFLELSFEFKTAEQNGILLSVSNPRNSPALSVELQNGAVVMKIDRGLSAISKVSNNLGSDFALCDNRWHNVTAVYSTGELTVNVDGIRQSWVQSDDGNSMLDEISAPLYVGGLKDSAPVGTLKIRENFKGCIRKLKIDESLKDWSDMEELNNVLLDSCPVQK